MSHIESVGTAKFTSLLPLSSIFKISKFSINLLSISKLIRSLDCSITFFLDYCVFQEIGMLRTVDTVCESRGLHHPNTGVKSVACVTLLLCENYITGLITLLYQM